MDIFLWALFNFGAPIVRFGRVRSGDDAPRVIMRALASTSWLNFLFSRKERGVFSLSVDSRLPQNIAAVWYWSMAIRLDCLPGTLPEFNKVFGCPFVC